MILKGCAMTEKYCQESRITGRAASVPSLMKNLMASALCLSASSALISPLCHLHCNVFLTATMCQPCQAVPVIQTELSEGIPIFRAVVYQFCAPPPRLSAVMGMHALLFSRFKAKETRSKSQSELVMSFLSKTHLISFLVCLKYLFRVSQTEQSLMGC